jgi:uncharacterized membrane protein YkvA (DUF1232 family)
MFEQLKAAARQLKQELAVYRRVLKHPRTPRVSRILLAAAIGYALLPFDLIPDWIPLIGHIDDLVIVPALVILALRLVPEDVMAECRTADDKAGTGNDQSQANH